MNQTIISILTHLWKPCFPYDRFNQTMNPDLVHMLQVFANEGAFDRRGNHKPRCNLGIFVFVGIGNSFGIEPHSRPFRATGIGYAHVTPTKE